MIFTVVVVALALASGIQASAVERDQIQTFPGVYAPPVLLPPTAPEEEPVEPEVVENPCDACFEYMTALIDQLTENVVEPEIEAHPMPEVGVLPVPNPGVSVPVGPRPLGFF